MKRPIFCFVTYALLQIATLAEEFIPDLLIYDPPEFFQSFKPSSGPGANPFPTKFHQRELLAHGNNSKSFRQLNVSLRSVGVTIGEGKRVSKKPVSFVDLHELMKTTVVSDRAKNDPKVEEVKFGGRKALHLKQVVSMPQKAPGASLIFDYFWVQISPNRVLEVQAVASNNELLKTITDSFKTLKVIAK